MIKDHNVTRQVIKHFIHGSSHKLYNIELTIDVLAYQYYSTFYKHKNESEMHL